MKYFICTLEPPAEAQEKQTAPLEAMQLAIPTPHTERIIPVTKTQTAGYETGDEGVSVSLPVLFQQQSAPTPHGVILRSEHALKTTLLTPGIDRDLEIPEESIHGLPGVFDSLSRYFKGVYFDNQNLILILNTEKIMEEKQ
ncbi:MAG: hypothetical protein FWB99_08930 [Treponema sp.]|nr:hypothetical protein [Treponema sp.]